MDFKKYKSAVGYFYYLSLIFLVAAVNWASWSENSILKQKLWNSVSERGFFELATAFGLFLVSVIYFLSALGPAHPKKKSGLFLILGLICLWGGLEEISWGQHIFQFDSPDFFKKNNIQGETNFHNFLPHFIYHSLLFNSVNGFFILVPLLILSGSGNNLGQLWKKYLGFAPGWEWVFIFLCSSCFQLYHSTLYGGMERLDALIFFGLLIHSLVVLYQGGSKRKFLLVGTGNWILVLIASVSLIFNRNIFGTRVYEIREYFIVLGFIYFSLDWLEEPAAFPRK